MKRRALVIYNDESTLGGLAGVLQGGGFEVVPQASPIGATRVIAQEKIDLVVVDVTMPSMRTERLSTLLHRWQRFVEVPIVLIAPTSEWREEWGPERRGVYVVAAAATPRELLSRIERAFGRDSWRIEPTEPEEFALQNELDMANALARIRMRATRLGMTGLPLQGLLTAASELGRNILLYAREGTLVFEPRLEGRIVRIRAVDAGPGIPNLDEILRGRYRSRTGLGKGLRGVHRLAKRMTVDTSPKGTRIQADFAF